jgi:hypothetical protein
MQQRFSISTIITIMAMLAVFQPRNADAAIVRLEFNAQVVYRAPGLNVAEAPFQLGDPVSILAYYDTTATDLNPDFSGRYSMLSLSVNVGSYSASTNDPAALSLTVVNGQPGDLGGSDYLRLVSPFPYPGPTISGDDVLGYPLVGFELYMEDYTRTALTSSLPPSSFDSSDFGYYFGQMIFNNYYAGPIVSFGNFSGSATVVPLPSALMLFASGLFGLAGFFRNRRR